MTVLELLGTCCSCHRKVVIKDEYDMPIVSGDIFDFVARKSEYMRYEELHEREVELFYFSDNILYVRLKELPDLNYRKGGENDGILRH